MVVASKVEVKAVEPAVVIVTEDILEEGRVVESSENFQVSRNVNKLEQLFEFLFD